MDEPYDMTQDPDWMLFRAWHLNRQPRPKRELRDKATVAVEALFAATGTVLERAGMRVVTDKHRDFPVLWVENPNALGRQQIVLCDGESVGIAPAHEERSEPTGDPAPTQLRYDMLADAWVGQYRDDHGTFASSVLTLAKALLEKLEPRGPDPYVAAMKGLLSRS